MTNSEDRVLKNISNNKVPLSGCTLSQALNTKTFLFSSLVNHGNVVQTTPTPILAATIAESKKGDKMTRWALPVGQPLIVQEG